MTFSTTYFMFKERRCIDGQMNGWKRGWMNGWHWREWLAIKNTGFLCRILELVPSIHVRQLTTLLTSSPWDWHPLLVLQVLYSYAHTYIEKKHINNHKNTFLRKNFKYNVPVKNFSLYSQKTRFVIS